MILLNAFNFNSIHTRSNDCSIKILLNKVNVLLEYHKLFYIDFFVKYLSRVVRPWPDWFLSIALTLLLAVFHSGTQDAP